MTVSHPDPVLDNLARLLADQERQPGTPRQTLADDPTWLLLERSGYLSADEPDGDFQTACRVLQLCSGSPHAAGLPVGNAILVIPWLRRSVGLDSTSTVAGIAVDTGLTMAFAGDQALTNGSAQLHWAWPGQAWLICGQGDGGSRFVAEVPAQPPPGLTVHDRTLRGGIPSARIRCQEVRLPRPTVRFITDKQWQDLRTRTALSVTLQMAGAISRIATMTVEYAALRVQFGKSIDQFQMVKANLVALVAEAAVAEAAASSAAELVDGDQVSAVAQVAVLAAQVRAAQAATVATRLAHQVHGTIGVTQEHPLHKLTTLLWPLRDIDVPEGEAQVALGGQLARGGPDFLIQMLVNEGAHSRA